MKFENFRQKLCSLCGLCMADSCSAKESMRICVFNTGWLGAKEKKLFGRERSLRNTDEMRFGISRQRFVGRLKQPLPRTQFTGIITRMSQKAFESGLVEGVVTLHRSREDYFFPKPVLARSTKAILSSGGSKPVLAPTLVSLDEAYKQGIQKLLVIGTPCQIHNLRSFQETYPYLRDMEIHTIGIPCTDNANPRRFRWMLRRVSRSHTTARHVEYMQDYTCHITHEDGSIEKVPFFSFPRELFGTNVFAESCMACFDYMNSLADITVGYLGAPLDRKKMPQWVIVRTEKGAVLRDLLSGELEIEAEFGSGDRRPGILMYANKIIPRLEKGEIEPVKPGRDVSLKEGREIAEMLYKTGPKGLEFAEYAVDMHLVRNYHYVKFNYPNLLDFLVPRHVRKILEEYDISK